MKNHKTYEETLKIRIEMKANRLKESAVTIRNDMNKLIGKLDGGFYAGVNGLGEIQSQGQNLDRECAELRLMLETLSEITTLNEKLIEEGI